MATFEWSGCFGILEAGPGYKACSSLKDPSVPRAGHCCADIPQVFVEHLLVCQVLAENADKLGSDPSSKTQ